MYVYMYMYVCMYTHVCVSMLHTHIHVCRVYSETQLIEQNSFTFREEVCSSPEPRPEVACCSMSSPGQVRHYCTPPSQEEPVDYVEEICEAMQVR